VSSATVVTPSSSPALGSGGDVTRRFDAKRIRLDLGWETLRKTRNPLRFLFQRKDGRGFEDSAPKAGELVDRLRAGGSRGIEPGANGFQLVEQCANERCLVADRGEGRLVGWVGHGCTLGLPAPGNGRCGRSLRRQKHDLCPRIAMAPVYQPPTQKPPRGRVLQRPFPFCECPRGKAPTEPSLVPHATSPAGYLRH
jgi:hypothetical protein